MVCAIRHQVKANASWCKHDFLHGNHELKFGYDYSPSILSQYLWSAEQQDYYLIPRNGVPFEMGTFNIPVDPLNRADYTARSPGQLAAGRPDRQSRHSLRSQQVDPPQSRPAGTFATAQTFPASSFRFAGTSWRPHPRGGHHRKSLSVEGRLEPIRQDALRGRRRRRLNAMTVNVFDG